LRNVCTAGDIFDLAVRDIFCIVVGISFGIVVGKMLVVAAGVAMEAIPNEEIDGQNAGSGMYQFEVCNGKRGPS